MSSSYFLYRLLAIFLLFCLSKASGGTCLSYGHSCWGGHGKRNGAPNVIGPSQKQTSGWYISKLLDSNPENQRNYDANYKNQNLESEEVDNFRQNGYQQYLDSDAEKNGRYYRNDLDTNFKSNKWDSEADDSEEEIMLLTPKTQHAPIKHPKLRLLQIMD